MSKYTTLACAALLVGCTVGDSGDPPDSAEGPDAGVTDAVVSTARYIRPPSVCAHDGNGKAHGCATSTGGQGAFNTWSNSKSWVPPGTVLYVDGTWKVTSYILFRSSGTAAAPIAITSYDTDTPAVIHGDLSGLFYIQGNYVGVNHVHIANATGTCMAVFGASPTQLIDHVTVSNNVFERCYNAISIARAEDVLVSGNLLENVGGSDDGHGHCIYPAEGASHVEVRGNRCNADAGIYASHCLHVYHAEAPGPAQDISFHDNVCDGFSTGAGIYSDAQNVRVYGNSFINLRKTKGADGVGLRCGVNAGQAGGSGVFMNNIIEGSVTSAVEIMSRASCDVAIDFNAYYQPGETPVFRAQGSNGTVAAVPWASWRASHDAHSTLVDPRLDAIATGDVHLLSTSPVRNRGTDGYAGAKDVDGHTRIVGGTIDIGAAESQEPL
jgi:hypothetical protein